MLLPTGVLPSPGPTDDEEEEEEADSSGDEVLDETPPNSPALDDPGSPAVPGPAVPFGDLGDEDPQGTDSPFMLAPEDEECEPVSRAPRLGVDEE